jgi:hypothetical protein
MGQLQLQQQQFCASASWALLQLLHPQMNSPNSQLQRHE